MDENDADIFENDLIEAEESGETEKPNQSPEVEEYDGIEEMDSEEVHIIERIQQNIDCDITSYQRLRPPLKQNNQRLNFNNLSVEKQKPLSLVLPFIELSVPVTLLIALVTRPKGRPKCSKNKP